MLPTYLGDVKVNLKKKGHENEKGRKELKNG